MSQFFCFCFLYLAVLAWRPPGLGSWLFLTVGRRLFMQSLAFVIVFDSGQKALYAKPGICDWGPSAAELKCSQALGHLKYSLWSWERSHSGRFEHCCMNSPLPLQMAWKLWCLLYLLLITIGLSDLVLCRSIGVLMQIEFLCLNAVLHTELSFYDRGSHFTGFAWLL